jgi:hypothetical protein
VLHVVEVEGWGCRGGRQVDVEVDAVVTVSMVVHIVGS